MVPNAFSSGLLRAFATTETRYCHLRNRLGRHLKRILQKFNGVFFIGEHFQDTSAGDVGVGAAAILVSHTICSFAAAAGFGLRILPFAYSNSGCC